MASPKDDLLYTINTVTSQRRDTAHSTIQHSFEKDLNAAFKITESKM